MPSVQNFAVFGKMTMTGSSEGFIWSSEFIIFLERGKVVYQQDINDSFTYKARDAFFFSQQKCN